MYTNKLFRLAQRKKSRRKIWPFPSSCLGRKEQEITQEREWVENDSYRAEVMMRKDASLERDGCFLGYTSEATDR